ncbi:MAG: BatA domain-containing protein [Planctomycetes bacterium]|nr:BatA domain-containing protein [Planctomycetota bacterium]
MSFLTPLYIAGLLAVSLPLVFHLIRRSPRGRFQFSSLMFLSPSPPRLTRRSRLDNLLLLILRATALGLLALAFARPFLRESARLQFDPGEGRVVAILLDTSASIQREDLWQQALARADSVFDDLGPYDEAALFTFDSHVRVEVPFNRALPADRDEHLALLRARLQSLAPTSAESKLGEALIAVAEDLHQQGDAADRATDTIRQIILISDVQDGSRTDALQAYQWPDDVQLAVHAVAPAATSNATLRPAANLHEQTGQEQGPQLRIRVTNDRLSSAERFQLRWEGDDFPSTAAESIDVHVPPGETRVVRVPQPPADLATCRLVLSGDDHAFDNTLYLVSAEQEELSVVYLGSDSAADVQGLRYYLERAFPETPERKVRIIAQQPREPLAPDVLRQARLIVVGQAIPDEQADRLQRYVDGGGTLFYVLTDAAAGESLGRIMGIDNLPTEEAATDDYAMLAEILFSHPLLTVFADPRFNDFTTIHFWKHRRVQVDDVPGVQVLARFDDGDPALFERPQGEGRLLVLASSWRPVDSQLARSTKFVPLLSGVLNSYRGADALLPFYEVGDRVMFGAGKATSGPRAVRKPDGALSKLAQGARSFDETDLPGVYHLSLGETRQPLAVNLAASESRTAPMEPGTLEELGVRLGRQPTRAELAEKHRQMRDVELEGRQKLWRWLIVAALGVLVAETWLAGYLSRTSIISPEVSP